MPNVSVKNNKGKDITAEIIGIFNESLENIMKNFRKLTLDDITPNPMLIRLIEKASDLDSADKIVSYLVNSRVDRSISTTLGTSMKRVVAQFCHNPLSKNHVLYKENQDGDTEKWHIVLKAGPNTVNSNDCLQINEYLRGRIGNQKNSFGLLGMTYGTDEQVSTVIKSNLKYCFLSGRDFWEFLSEDPNCYLNIYEIARLVNVNYIGSDNLTLKELIDSKTLKLTKEFCKKYDTHGPTMWTKLLERNM